MSEIFRCDAAGCDARVTGTYRADEDRWYPPAEWRSFIFDDWKVHGCSPEHLEDALSQKNDLTPLLGSWFDRPRPRPRKDPPA